MENMTNEDIIKNLRHCAASEGCGKDCQLYKEYGCYFKLMYAAADALESADKLIAALLENIEHWKSDVVKLRAQIPKEGEWIDIDGTMFAECSVCGKRHYGCTTPYCDMCGARMRGELCGPTDAMREMDEKEREAAERERKLMDLDRRLYEIKEDERR